MWCYHYDGRDNLCGVVVVMRTIYAHNKDELIHAFEQIDYIDGTVIINKRADNTQTKYTFHLSDSMENLSYKMTLYMGIGTEMRTARALAISADSCAVYPLRIEQLIKKIKKLPRRIFE